MRSAAGIPAACIRRDNAARLHDARVAVAFRGLLHNHFLHGLPPALAESEYRVKDAGVEARVYAQPSATLADIAIAIQNERLPAAVLAPGLLCGYWKGMNSVPVDVGMCAGSGHAYTDEIDHRNQK
jgi:hypothetical protein